MLCIHCGQREATEHVLYLRAGREPTAGPPAPPAELPLEFQEAPRASAGPTLCAACLSALAPPGVDLAELEALAHAHSTAAAERLRADAADKPAPALRGLVEQVLLASTAPRAELPRLRQALVRLLKFVATPPGRTAANLAFLACWVDTDEGWRAVNRNRARWQYLPASYQEVLGRLGAMALAVAEPDLAEALAVTPEQLLAAAQTLDIGSGAT
jgi:hypothetical protein